MYNIYIYYFIFWGDEKRFSGKLHSVDGFAYIPDISAPNKLEVNLPIKFINSTLFRNNANYQVIDTDYSTYSLVYSCLQIFDFKDEFVWILSRQKTLNKRIIDNLKIKMTKLNIETKHLVLIDQNC